MRDFIFYSLYTEFVIFIALWDDLLSSKIHNYQSKIHKIDFFLMPELVTGFQIQPILIKIEN